MEPTCERLARVPYDANCPFHLLCLLRDGQYEVWWRSLKKAAMEAGRTGVECKPARGHLFAWWRFRRGCLAQVSVTLPLQPLDLGAHVSSAAIDACIHSGYGDY